MNASEFLHALWPTDGYYCIAMLVKTGLDGKGFYFKHFTFSSIEEAASFAVREGQTKDVYVTMHALHQRRVDNPSKPGKFQVRTHANMRAARCFFADLDIGAGKDYPDRVAGLAALKTFLKQTGLPAPTILSSGRGFHLFWMLTEEIPSDAWKVTALKIRALVNHYEFKIDPTRIDDQASVLRIPGTLHHKDPKNPQPVAIARSAPHTPTAAFVGMVDAAAATVPSTGLLGSSGEGVAGGGDEDDNVSPACTIVELSRACGMVRHALTNAATQTEPQWFAMIGLLRFVFDPRKWIHKMSSKHPGYSVTATEEKWGQYRGKIAVTDGLEKPMGPSTCSKMASVYPTRVSEICGKCWYKGNPGSSPCVAATRMPIEKPADDLPDPPRPFVRTKAGVMMMPVKPADPPIRVLDYDLYPIRLIDDPLTLTKSITWGSELPLRGKVEFNTPASAINDVKALAEITANTGIMVKYNQFSNLRSYMSAYIAELQKYALDKQQHSHTGWAKNFTEFVMKDEVITKDGSKPVLVTDNVMTSAAAIHKKGTLARQVAHLDWYNKPEYIRHQVLMLCSLAAPIFYMTDQNGVIVNASGESGASKSTALYAGAGFWGDGKAFALNGTNNGATVKGRNERVMVLANLPLCVDEITLMQREDAKDLAMSITQPGHRIRLLTNGKERKVAETVKSTILISTANNSLHDTLSVNNQAGTAGSMRVFEIKFEKNGIHTKPEADDFRMALSDNYGWIGPAFMTYVVANLESVQLQVRAEMRKVDTLGEVDPAERFWTAVMATVIVCARIAYQIKLLPFAPAPIEAWLIQEQLKTMRNVVQVSYADPVETLMAFIETHAADFLVVNQGTNGTNITKGPRSSLAGRLETDTRMLYLSLGSFKTFCDKTGVPITAAMAAYAKSGVATTLNYTLGRGTSEYNFGQSRVIAIDLRNEMISGRKELKTVEASKVVGIKR